MLASSEGSSNVGEGSDGGGGGGEAVNLPAPEPLRYIWPTDDIGVVVVVEVDCRL